MRKQAQDCVIDRTNGLASVDCSSSTRFCPPGSRAEFVHRTSACGVFGALIASRRPTGVHLHIA